MSFVEDLEKQFGLKYEVMIKIGEKYDSYKNRAKFKQIPFNIPFSVFNYLIKQPCHYCNTKKDMDVIGIDRFNNNGGYLPGNCVPCCWDCNKSKGNQTVENFEKYIKKFNPSYSINRKTLVWSFMKRR